MQPLQYIYRFTTLSCKDTSITQAAAAPRNLDAATTLRSAGVHATITQPLHYKLQPQVPSPPAATLHGKTQGFALRLPPQQAPCNGHAATTMRFAASRGLHACIYLCRWQQNMTRITQPLHCDLQPEIQEAQRTTHT